MKVCAWPATGGAARDVLARRLVDRWPAFCTSHKAGVIVPVSGDEAAAHCGCRHCEVGIVPPRLRTASWARQRTPASSWTRFAAWTRCYPTESADVDGVLQVANTRPKRFGFAGWRLIALTGSYRLRLAT